MSTDSFLHWKTNNKQLLYLLSYVFLYLFLHFTRMNKILWPGINVFWSHSDPQDENGLCSKWRGSSSLASGSIRSIDRPAVWVGFVWMPDGIGWHSVQFHMVPKFNYIIIFTISILTIIISQLDSVFCLIKLQHFNYMAFPWLTDWLVRATRFKNITLLNPSEKANIY
jgi:hypothetical protein